MSQQNNESGSPGFPPAGYVDSNGASRFFGVHRVTVNLWVREGRLRAVEGAELGVARRPRRMFAALELERFRAEMAAEAAARGVMPEGFVDRDGACRMFGVAEGTWVVWERTGRVPKGQWGRSRTNKPCRIYPVEELERVREAMRPADQPHREPTRRDGGVTYHVPDGYVRLCDAPGMFGVEHGTWRRWELEGRIDCGRRMDGAGPKIYPVEALRRLVEENGRYSPPYPDPDRPGVYRLPLSGRDMRRREAIIDAADLALVEGKRWHWSTPGPDKPGQVATGDGKRTVRLRQVIMGVSGTNGRVGHVNGDPLDCRRANLFVRTMQEQERAGAKHKGYGGRPCSSRYKGVCLFKPTGRWRVGIVVDGKNRHLGYFRDEIAAAEAYDEAARELFGEHARLNFPDGVEAKLMREAA